VVFGELLGGVATRAGERFHENLQRQRGIEDWQRQQHLGFLTDQIRNWDNLNADQQTVLGTQFAKAVGANPKDVESWVTATRGIHSMIPQIQATPETLGPTQRTGPVAVTPSTEAPVRGVAAPASIQIGQLPQPGEILTPSLVVPSTGHTASFGRDMTPNQIKAQQAADQAAALRQQRMSEIGTSPLRPDLRQAAYAKQFDVNAVPVISSEIGATSREKVAESQANQFKGAGRLLIRNGMPLPVRGTGKDEFILDPQHGWVPLVPQEGDQIYEKPTPLGTVQGASDVYSLERAGPQKGTVTPLKVGVRPRASASGAASRSFRDEMSLRKDFENHPITKQADETNRQVKLAEGALAQGSTNFVAIDQALINVFNKMIDPNSVVREGEYARTIDNTPLLNRIKGKMAAIQAGGAGLTEEERRALVAISKRFAADSQTAFATRANEFKRMASERGFNPNNVVVPRSGTANIDAGNAKQQLIDYLKQKQQQLGGRR
jgi:hypothetical protein